MYIPHSLNLGFLQIPTLVIFALVGVLYLFFQVWYEGRKDGFDNERLFDLVFLSVISGGLTAFFLTRAINWSRLYRPSSFILLADSSILVVILTILLSFIPILLLVRKWNWSIFRILDIYSIGYSFIIAFLSLGQFLIIGDLRYLSFFVVLISIYILVFRYRGYKFFSGMIFSLFLFSLISIGFLFFREKGYLLFYTMLITISVLNLYFRRKKIMNVKDLPTDLANRFRNILLKKEKELRAVEKQITSEDPYTKEGRAEENSESMDEAILEDYPHEVAETRKAGVVKIKTQVKRALAAMKIGKYGICEVCGTQIDRARLSIYPEATKCVDCSRRSEQ